MVVAILGTLLFWFVISGGFVGMLSKILAFFEEHFDSTSPNYKGKR